MSGQRVNHFPLEELFDCKKGNSKYTKKYCHLHKGNYEVYTGTTIGHFACIDTFDFTEPNLTYTTDGEYAGTVTIIKDQKYNIGGHRAVLIAKQVDLDLEYFQYILNTLLKTKVKDGSVPSVTWTNIKKLRVPVPVREDGTYDLQEQRKTAQKLSLIKERKKNLLKRIEEFEDSYLILQKKSELTAQVPLNTIFEYVRGTSCTKSFCNQHKGAYPVWSANNIKPLAYVDFYKYDGKYISLSRNGIAGKITILDGKFNINEDRFLLIPKVKNIDYDFIKYTVEPILRSKKKGRSGHNGQNEFTKISFNILNNVKIQIPIDNNGNYDLEKQKEIADEYRTFYDTKKIICDRVRQLLETEVII